MPIATVALLLAVAADHLRGAEVRARRASIDSLLLALEAKDLYTQGSLRAVAARSVDSGSVDGPPRAGAARPRTAALLHDVGKLAVDRNLLRKRGRLSLDEYRRVQAHNPAVAEVLDGIGFLEPAIPMSSTTTATSTAPRTATRPGQRPCRRGPWRRQLVAPGEDHRRG